MNDTITIMWHDARDPAAETVWQQVVVPYCRGRKIQHYLQEQQGLMSRRMRMSLRCYSQGSWSRVRMTHIPQAGDAIALVPRN